jgi:hypothetical protein
LFFIFITSQTYAQQQGERLVAMSQYTAHNGAFIPYDSTTYIYSGSRAVDSIWTYPVQAFDSSFTWYNESTGGVYIYQKQVQTWRNNILLSDTLFDFDTATSMYKYVNYLRYSYYPGGLSAGYITFGWDSAQQKWDSAQQTIRVYDSVGNPTLEVNLSLINNVWDTSSEFILTYNSANLITSDPLIAWSGHQKNGGEGIFSYNSLGQMDTSIEYYLSHDSIWGLAYMEIDSYDVSGYLSSDFFWNWSDSVGWYAPARYTYSYDANHNLTSILEQIPDTARGIWVNYWHNLRSYDSYNMITSYERDNWDTATSTWIPMDEHINYYYQLYTPDTTIATGIATTSAQAELRIYPVPAADMLSLDVKWQEPQPATATIYDASGRKYTEWQLPDALSYHGYVPVSAIPAGTYILQIKGSCGSISRSFDVMR